MRKHCQRQTRKPRKRKRQTPKLCQRKRQTPKQCNSCVPVPNPDSTYKADVQRIRADAKANGFELYDAGNMGLGLRTLGRIKKGTLFPYTGKVIELDVDSETGNYTGYPKDCSYTADFTTRDGRPCVVDSFDLKCCNKKLR